ncbi:MAG: hypothetical protein HPY74_12320 [Firmicutes bacterium]|nr:hypothetical protein [Bacillota bacterium]
MPVFKSGLGLAPEWCEMEFFEIVHLTKGLTHVFERMGKKEKLIVGKGACRISVEGRTIDAEEGCNIDLTTPEGQFVVVDVLLESTLIRMCGHWGDEVGGSGIFTVEKSEITGTYGDPSDYPKNTNFDNHYHDCDEYWIIYEGSGIAVSEGKSYKVGPGDCIATRMGHHHDFPQVFETIKAVCFETTLRGCKRLGHLWNYKHGEAQPLKDRM